jgi:ribulose-phosphate 3-epimerase
MKISPSLLAADFKVLGAEVEKIAKAGAEMLHLDVMDGHFVPNMSFGPDVIKAIRPVSDIFFDVHLMIEKPERFVDKFIAAGADGVTIHYESTENPAEVLKSIKAAGKKAGLSISPDTPAEAIEELLPLADMILVMTVYPGFGGQKLIPAQLEKAQKVRNMLNAKGLTAVDVQADGGIGLGNLADVLAHGINVVVAGTAVFGAPDPAAVIAEMRKLEK